MYFLYNRVFTRQPSEEEPPPEPEVASVESKIKEAKVEAQEKVALPELKKATTYEQAISSAKYGVFQILLMMVAAFGVLAVIFQTLGASYIIPKIDCDFNLKDRQKGFVMALNLLGMVTPLWCCNYFSDVIGRKKLVIAGFAVHALLRVAEGFFSKTIPHIMIFEYFCGFVLGGPSIVLFLEVFEFHSVKYRVIVIEIFTIVYTFGNVLLGLMGWMMLPPNYEMKVFSRYSLTAWNVFIMVTAIPSVVVALAGILVPESPKYLFQAEQYAKGISVIKQIHKINTFGKDVYKFSPFEKVYVAARKRSSRKFPRFMMDDLWHYGDVLKGNYYNVLICSAMQALNLSCFYMIRFWVPDVFSILDENRQWKDNSNICGIINRLYEFCPDEDVQTTYMNVFLSHFGILLANFSVWLIIYLIKNSLVIVAFAAVSAVTSVCIYFTKTLIFLIILITLTEFMLAHNIILILVLAQDSVKSNAKDLALVVNLTIARLFSVVFAIVFAYLFDLQCIAPFVIFGTTLCAAAAVSIFAPAHLTFERGDKRQVVA